MLSYLNTQCNVRHPPWSLRPTLASLLLLCSHRKPHNILKSCYLQIHIWYIFPQAPSGPRPGAEGVGLQVWTLLQQHELPLIQLNCVKCSLNSGTPLLLTHWNGKHTTASQ